MYSYLEKIIIKNRSRVYKFKVGVERATSNYCKVASERFVYADQPARSFFTESVTV